VVVPFWLRCSQLILFIVAITFLFLFEIILDIFRTANASLATLIDGVLYLVVYIAISIYFFYETYKTGIKLQNAKKNYSKQIKFYKYVVIVVSGMVITIIGAIILATPLYNDPPIALLTWGIIYVGLSISSFGKIYVFTTKQSNEESTKHVSKLNETSLELKNTEDTKEEKKEEANEKNSQEHQEDVNKINRENNEENKEENKEDEDRKDD